MSSISIYVFRINLKDIFLTKLVFLLVYHEERERFSVGLINWTLGIIHPRFKETEMGLLTYFSMIIPK